jgi:hypothetical protein
MNGQRTRDGLLFVIAVCLVLIVLRLYSGDLVTPAQASLENPKSFSNMHIYGCLPTNSEKECTWVPVRADRDGRLKAAP